MRKKRLQVLAGIAVLTASAVVLSFDSTSERGLKQVVEQKSGLVIRAEESGAGTLPETNEKEPGEKSGMGEAAPAYYGGFTKAILTDLEMIQQYYVCMERLRISFTEESYLSDSSKLPDESGSGASKENSSGASKENGPEISKENESGVWKGKASESPKESGSGVSKNSGSKSSKRSSSKASKGKKSGTSKKNNSKKKKEKNSTETLKESDSLLYQLPSYSDYHGFKTYEPYRAITCRSSPQWKLQQWAYTDEYGLRRVDGRICVAIGSYFETQIGQYFDLILENGTVIPCIKGDEKADKHTDDKYHIYTMHSGCCSEFLVDAALLREYIGGAGDVSKLFAEWDSPVVEIRVYSTKYPGLDN